MQITTTFLLVLLQRQIRMVVWFLTLLIQLGVECASPYLIKGGYGYTKYSRIGTNMGICLLTNDKAKMMVWQVSYIWQVNGSINNDEFNMDRQLNWLQV